MKIKSVKNNEENKYPTENEISSDDKRLKKTLKRWVKLGIGLAVLIALLTTGIYFYEKIDSLTAGGMVEIPSAKISVCNSHIENYAGKKVNGQAVKNLITTIKEFNNNENEHLKFPTSLTIYYEGASYSEVSELEELWEKVKANKYYGVQANDTLPASERDYYYDTIYIEDYVEPEANSKIN